VVEGEFSSLPETGDPSRIRNNHPVPPAQLKWALKDLVSRSLPLLVVVNSDARYGSN
jgi:hypothetical protein